MRLNWVLRNGIAQTSGIEPYGFEKYEEWLDLLIRQHPDVIFFYTIDSTDIWPSPDPDHACSCHVHNRGPCHICKELGCEVWDSNQFVLPIFS